MSPIVFLVKGLQYLLERREMLLQPASCLQPSCCRAGSRQLAGWVIVFAGPVLAAAASS